MKKPEGRILGLFQNLGAFCSRGRGTGPSASGLLARAALFLAVALGTAAVAFAQDSAGATESAGLAAESTANPGVEFGIRFFDRRVYYAADDPILIQVSLTNNSPFTYRFKLADDRAFSVDFEVRTVMNRLMESATDLVRRRTQSRQVFFREIAVEPGESFSFVENLRDFVKLDEPGAFVVRAFIHLDLFRPESAPVQAGPDFRPANWSAPVEVPLTGVLASGRLSLNIRMPSVSGPDGLPLAMDVATGAVLVRERLPPDEVVEQTIRARQLSQWERFFLYLDLDEMIARNPTLRRRWQAESAEGRQRMVDLFRAELQNPTTVEAISLIPNDFTIERTEHSGNEGTVTVIMRFRGSQVTDVKRYTYYLSRRDDVWGIVDYSVINLGAE